MGCNGFRTGQRCCWRPPSLTVDNVVDNIVDNTVDNIVDNIVDKRFRTGGVIKAWVVSVWRKE